MKLNISVCAIGGTICMSSNGDKKGVKPTFSADDLVKAVPILSKMANIKTQTLFAVASGSLKLENLLEVIKWAKNEIKNGANAIILTQGTDTLEESAFFIDLLWDKKEPFIITGAMRNPDNISSDGAGNIYASFITAICKKSQNRGVLVVLNDVIHSAKWVHKSHTSSLDTFISVNGGAEGYIIEGEAKYVKSRDKRKTFKLKSQKLKKVMIINSFLGEDSNGIKALLPLYDGFVLNAFGAGHVSVDVMNVIKKEAKNKSFVISHRVDFGRSAYNTYGYVGSEISLQENNAIMSGWLSAIKARLLLIVLLTNQEKPKQIIEIFKGY